MIGVGGFEKFSIKIYSRWGAGEIFKSNKIEFVTSSINSCSAQSITEPFYKMGEWDGITLNGEIAPSGVYVYEIIYKAFASSENKNFVGTINLIR